jgi:acyl-coenzyme A thioesterase PaaI-like protein
MSQALIALGWEAFTAELRVRFRRQVTPGDSLAVTGWVTQRQKRRILAEAALKDAGGLERAHAWATFLAVRG